MACHSCSMPTVEGFTQLPQTEYFGSKGDGKYSCQTQKGQTCVYTAQGDMVCGAGNWRQENKKSVFEGFTASNTAKRVVEGFPRVV